MTVLKEWWREIGLVAGFIALAVAWYYLYPLLAEYNANAPVYFYAATEVAWNITAAMAAFHFLRGKKWFRLESIKAMSKVDTDRLKGSSWFWFRANRVVALAQPGITMALVILTKAPWTIKLLLGAVLAGDMLHSLLVIWRSKVWEEKN